MDRIRKLSPFGKHPKWRIQSVVVKSGDDLRQEQLAVQLISTIHQIFKDADLPLWLYSYNVVAISSNTGLIETIPDAISIDSLKKRIPNMKSLEDYFVSVSNKRIHPSISLIFSPKVYGERTSLRFIQAQRSKYINAIH
jgi:phosphatidylinositol 4-kinase